MNTETKIKMTEINNNISSFGRNVEKVEVPEKDCKIPCSEKIEEGRQAEYVPDTGVLGRSQVKRANGGNIAKSVDEAVALAKDNPALLCGCESIYNCLYKDFLEQGDDPAEAHIKALLAEEEFYKCACNI